MGAGAGAGAGGAAGAVGAEEEEEGMKVDEEAVRTACAAAGTLAMATSDPEVCK